MSLLKLPIKLEELGGITVEHGDAGGARGFYNPETKQIVIDSHCSPVGEAVILVHEMLHAAECALIEAGVFKRHINHQFVHAAAFGAVFALGRAGALRGVTPEDLEAFLQEAREE